MATWEKIIIPIISVILSVFASSLVASWTIQTTIGESKKSIYTDINEEIIKIHNGIVGISKFKDQKNIDKLGKEVPTHIQELSNLKNLQKYIISEKVITSISDYLDFILSKRNQNKRIKYFNKNEIEELERLGEVIDLAIKDDLKIKILFIKF